MIDLCKMVKKVHKHKKKESTRPEVIVLCKNNAFVSNSLSKTRVSSVKFTADGEMTAKTVGKLDDRHLQAKLKLPELEERCAIPSNKDLYELSKQLADIEIDNEGNELCTKNLKPNIQEPEGIALQNSSALSRSVRPYTKDCMFNQIYNIVGNSSNIPNSKSKVHLAKPHKANNMNYKISKESTVHRVQRKPKKMKTKKLDSKKNSTLSDENCYKTVRFSQQPNQYNNKTDKQANQLMTHLSMLEPQENSMQKTMSQLNLLDIKIKELNRTVKLTMQTMVDCHAFTFLLILCIAACLIYILCYDIIVYINEERRYLAKMRSSSIALKCFYYVMRVLKVPIF